MAYAIVQIAKVQRNIFLVTIVCIGLISVLAIIKRKSTIVNTAVGRGAGRQIVLNANGKCMET